MNVKVTRQAFTIFFVSLFLTACSAFSSPSENSEVENHSLSEVILSPDLRIDRPRPVKNLIFRNDLIILQFYEAGSSLSVQGDISSFDIGGYGDDLDAAYILRRIYDTSFYFDDDDLNEKLKSSRLAFGIEAGDSKVVAKKEAEIFISFGKDDSNFAYIVANNDVYLLSHVGSLNDFEWILNNISSGG